VAFLVVHSTAAALSLLLPLRFGPARVLGISLFGAAVAASLSATVLRLIDPFLFETAYSRLFLTVCTVPVLRACLLPESVAERERSIENILRGLGYSVVVILAGAVREFLAAGSISVNSASGPASASLLPIAAQPAGAFILIGLAAAAFKAAMAAAKGSER